VNTNDIHKIVINPNKYYIHITGKTFSGNSWNLGWIGLGVISTDNQVIEVCEINHSIDYKIVSEWISHQ
jgi:hypothetical protein